jgi:hypothetical protein
MLLHGKFPEEDILSPPTLRFGALTTMRNSLVHFLLKLTTVMQKVTMAFFAKSYSQNSTTLHQIMIIP